LYQQVVTTLRQRIMDGAYQPGEQLVTEGELMVEFGVSRGTVRQAVGQLVDQGLVERMQGRGTFVGAGVKQLFGQRFSGSLADLMTETNRAGAREVEIEKHAKLPVQAAMMLQLDEPVGTIVRRVRTMDDKVFAYTVNYLPESTSSLVSAKELKTRGLMSLLAERGVALARATQSIRAQVADVDVSANLDVQFGVPVLFVERVVFDRADVPVDFVQTWYRGDMYEYTATLTLDADELPGAAWREQLG
jgi:GntR family transcriptional regulator